MQQKIHFECDYTEGAHPKILKRFMETNMEQTVGYGEDPYCQKAAELIRGLCKKGEAAVHFLVGGTQANLTLISVLQRPSLKILFNSINDKIRGCSYPFL